MVLLPAKNSSIITRLITTLSLKTGGWMRMLPMLYSAALLEKFMHDSSSGSKPRTITPSCSVRWAPLGQSHGGPITDYENTQ